VNYMQRFSERGERYTHLPVIIAIMNKVARQTATDGRRPPERMIVTDRPAFDFTTITAESERRLSASSRRELDVPQKDGLIVFASGKQARYRPVRTLGRLLSSDMQRKIL
jgi:hypothetical protein